MIYYNAFGKFVSENNIETFSQESEEKSKYMEEIKQFKSNLELGKLSKNQVEDKMKNFRELISKGKLSNEEKSLLDQVIKTTVRKMDGINLIGNLELGGIIKAKGFHLHDGTPIREIIRTKDKMALPLDKKGNVEIKKKVKVKGLMNVNAHKEYNITIGEGGDQINSRIGNKKSAHLYLNHRSKGNVNLASGGGRVGISTTNPVAKVDIHDGRRTGKNTTVKPSLYVTGSSHPGHPGKKGLAEFRHSNQSEGIGIGYNTIYATGSTPNQGISLKPRGKGVIRLNGRTDFGVNSSNAGELWINNSKTDHNPRGYATHFNYKKSGHNYIRGNTQITGTVTQKDGQFQVVNPKNGHNPTGWWTHFNHKNQALNYIRGKTEMRGETNFVDKGKGINISNPKNGDNKTGWGTHFNYLGRAHNYIRGKTEMRGEVNFVDKGKSVNISNGKHSTYNREGHATHFNYAGQGRNYIRGMTEMRGEVNLVDKAKGINIYNGKHGRNNPNGWTTHFNYQGKGINYIRGFTIHDGELRTNNPKNGNNPTGMASHLNYDNRGRNYLRGTTEIRGPQVNVISNSGVRVHGHGKVASFGSLNSGWCHFQTTAPKFYFNRSVQVNGSVSSYSNKPLRVDRGINIGGVTLYTGGSGTLYARSRRGTKRLL